MTLERSIPFSKHCTGWRPEHSNPPAGGYACFDKGNTERPIWPDAASFPVYSQYHYTQIGLCS